MEKRYPATITTTVCVPWNTNNTVDEELFRANVRLQIANGIQSIYILGTAGEGYAVDEPMYKRLTAVFAEEMRAPGLMPCAGIISLSAPEMLRRVEIGRALGVHDFQISLPSWGALADEEVYAFFHQVCDAFPDCRFMHYNNGARAKKTLDYRHYTRLAREVPNLVAAKYVSDSVEDIVHVMRAELPIQFIMPEYSFGIGSFMGECGLLASNTTMCFPKAWELFQAAQSRDISAVTRLLGEVAVNQTVLFETCTGQVINGAYDKIYAKMQLPAFPLRLYPPYRGFSEEQFAAFRAEMLRRLPEWVVSKK